MERAENAAYYGHAMLQGIAGADNIVFSQFCVEKWYL
jgi:hypothetical protein